MFPEAEFSGDYVGAEIMGLEECCRCADFPPSRFAGSKEQGDFVAGDYSALDFASDFGLEEAPLPLPELNE